MWVSCFLANAQEIPAVYSQLAYDAEKNLYLTIDGERYYADKAGPKYTLSQLQGKPQGTDDGFMLDFGDIEGQITYGLIPYGKAPHPLPVFRFTKTLKDGKTKVNIADDFKYPYDFVGWKESGQLTVGYRLIDKTGLILYDGEVTLRGKGPFEVVPSIYEGPFISNLTDKGAVIWCNTTLPVKAYVEVNGKRYEDKEATTYHEWHIKGLKPATRYDYKVQYGVFAQSYHFTSALEKGSRQPFVFGYTSDSRHATGGGERKIYGANGYIMKKMAALAQQQGAAFVQFTGDMINGYLNTKEETHVQYTNWKKAIEPFWHYVPYYVGMGNHEALGYIFRGESRRWKAFVDGFPYEQHSAEQAFAEAFVNPTNGPASEDGSAYDPNAKQIDFPSYQENVYTYTYGNTAIIVLNSDYWYAPSLGRVTASSGGLHGYIMDQQLAWLKKTVAMYEKDRGIDHVFVTQHTPAFPNGGHSRDDMWYNGNNAKRPIIAGKEVKKGIIERRDEYLDILINQSSKVLAILTGDEHNYNRLKLTKEVPIYPEKYPHKKIKVSRPIYQINNGAAGAPYYAQEVLPWSQYTEAFSVENALCLFHVEGKKVKMKVINPDTLNEIDEMVLRE